MCANRFKTMLHPPGVTSRFARDAHGAVYVEFLIAFLPLLVFFSSLLQLGLLQTAGLVNQHAAWMAARSAAVVMTDDPVYYGEASGPSVSFGSATACGRGEQAKTWPVTTARVNDVQQAATMILHAIDSSAQPTITFPSAPGGNDNRTSFGVEDMVYAQVHYTYPCVVPIGNIVVCGPGKTKDLVGESAFPLQGTNYNYPGI
jgi:Flp pilus assembly protein TadG